MSSEQSKKQPKYIFAGTGRCGTKAMAKLMRACGYTCEHDLGQPLDPGCVDAVSGWRIWKDLPSYPGATLVHLVRHPLGVIRSRYLRPFADFNEDWVDENVPDLPPRGTLEREMFYYLWVNDQVERAEPALRHRIEDGDAIIGRLGLTLSRTWTPNPMEHWHIQRQKAGAWDWSKLPDGNMKTNVRKMAELYGYGDVDSVA